MTRQSDLVEIVKNIVSNLPGREDEKSSILKRLEDGENTTAAQKKFVNLQTAAETVCVSTQTLRRWVSNGHLHNYGKGRKYLLSLDELTSITE